MSYASLYLSPWYDPGLLLLGNGIFLAYMFSWKGGDVFLRKLLIGYAFLAIADCMITGNLALIPAPVKPYLTFPFVILGDTRFFFFLERYRRMQVPSPSVVGAFRKSFLISLIVPASSYFAQQLFFPAANIRWMFLLYELLFLVVASCFVGLMFSAKSVSSDVPSNQRRWLRTIVLFELAFYSLWATVDVVILSGHEWGYVLRIVPDVLYYFGFVWIVALSAPKGIRP